MGRATEEELEFNVEGFLDYVGLDRLIRVVGLKRVIDEVGLKRVIAEMGTDELVASLSPAQRRELKRRLK